jgi:hypothetical protein
MPNGWAGRVSDFNMAETSQKKNPHKSAPTPLESKPVGNKEQKPGKRKSSLVLDEVGNCYWPI